MNLDEPKKSVSFRLPHNIIQALDDKWIALRQAGRGVAKEEIAARALHDYLYPAPQVDSRPERRVERSQSNAIVTLYRAGWSAQAISDALRVSPTLVHTTIDHA